MSTCRITAVTSVRLLLAGCLLAAAPLGVGQMWLTAEGDLFEGTRPASEAAPWIRIDATDASQLSVSLRTPGVELTPGFAGESAFVDVRCPQAVNAGPIGQPALPVVRKLFCAPRDATVEYSVIAGPPQTLPLDILMAGAVVRPSQGPASTDAHYANVVRLLHSQQPSLWSLLLPTFHDTAAYAENREFPAQQVRLTEVGVARDLRLMLLEITPVTYNPLRGDLAFYPDLHVDIEFAGAAFDPAARLPRGMERTVLNPPRGGQIAGRGGNLLIVSAQDFAGGPALAQFAAAKTAEGFDVTIHAVTSGDSRNDILSAITSLWGTVDAPDYLLIVGDADGIRFDPVDIADPVTVPPWSGGGTQGWTTDLPYACMDGAGDWMPDMVYSRISVRTEAELQAVVDKALYVDAGNFTDPGYAGRAALLAHPDPEAASEALNDQIIENTLQPRNMTCDRLYYESFGATTADVMTAINDGRAVVGYYGHSTGYHAWSLPRLDSTNVSALQNQNLYPFVVGFSCSGGQFHITDQEPGMLEHFVRVADKGAAGAFGTVDTLSYPWPTWATMYENVFQAIYRDNILEIGPACQAAQVDLVAYYGAADPVSRDYMEGFLLHGDPTMSVPTPPRPKYLIVTAPDYSGTAALNDFIAHRTASGFDVLTYIVSAGESTSSIKSYISSLWGTENQPAYVLLVGDTDGSTATSGTVPHWTGSASKHADTDWPYVCLGAGDDWYPEIPIGRFSVRNATQLQAVVDKTKFVEAGSFPDPNYVMRGNFLANGDSDVQSSSEGTHNWVIDNYFTPNGYTGVKLYASQGAGTSDVRNAIDDGALFTLYMGHSSSSGWWSPSFDQGDIGGLSNTGLYGMAFGWSCNSAHFSYDECYGETMLRAENKGAAVYVSASNYIYWGSESEWLPSVRHEKAFFRAFFEDGLYTVGDAWLAGDYYFLADHGNWDGDPNHAPSQNEDVCRNFLEEFVILGDPALQLPRPERFTLDATPTSSAVCLPTDSVNFAIEVAAMGGFALPVNLSVQGAPGGATVEFTVNSASPPFASQLTIGNLGVVTPGSYTLQVMGQSSTSTQTMLLELHVASGAPGSVSLTTPSNGATDISRLPTLIWATSPESATYLVEVAEDPVFGKMVFSTLTPAGSITLPTQLQSAKDYYWRVAAENACGSGPYSPTYVFTTLTQADYFTQLFASGFDLAGARLSLSPDGSGNFYEACLTPAADFNTEPSGGTSLSLTDDGSATVSPGASVWLYGAAYNTFYVNANGNITFDSGDGTYSESLSQHFAQSRVAALFDDLNPASGGTVSWKTTAEGVAVTWQNVPEYSSSNQNSFQIELFFNGEIHITWLGIASSDSVVGLSAGLGQPGDYVETDLSALPTCAPPATGACCNGVSCSVLTEDNCLAGGGTYFGDDVPCSPDPCIEYDSSCLIISEVVRGTESGGCPRWMEITNSGIDDFAFINGGVIVQEDGSGDIVVDVDLSGVVIAAGESLVINSNVNGTCTGAFDGVYGQAADVYTNAPLAFGNERLMLTDTPDGSNIIDIFGEFGVDGTGKGWDFTDGFVYRQAPYAGAMGTAFVPPHWYCGGVGSLAGDNPTALLLTLTTPGKHEVEEGCVTQLIADINRDDLVNHSDVSMMSACLAGPDIYTAPPKVNQDDFEHADLDGDDDADVTDFVLFQDAFDS